MRIFAILLMVTQVVCAQNLTQPYYCIKANVNDHSIRTALEKLEFTVGSVQQLHNPEYLVIADVDQSITETELAAIRTLDGLTSVAPIVMTARGNMMTYTDKILVKLRSESDLTILESELNRLDLEMIGPNRFDSRLMEVRTSSATQDAKQLAGKLKLTGLFHHVQPNYFHTLSDCGGPVNDNLFDRQWNLLNTSSAVQGNGTAGADMKVTEAWNLTMGSPDITIAILDSGVDTLHPEFAGKLDPGFDGSGQGSMGYPTPNFDEDGHGTCCAGIAAAIADNTDGIAGVAPDCRIVPIRVFNYINLGSGVIPWAETQWFLDGINWVWQETDASVASNSWGIPDDLLALFPGDDLLVNEAIEDAVENGRDGKGTPWFFSSGNDGVTDTIPLWPARIDITIAVNATSMCDEAKTTGSCDGENWAGNWGPGVDVSAPGVRIPAPDMLGLDGFHQTDYFNFFNGTSAACPNAAGVMALILSQTPLRTRWTAEDILKSSCDKVGGYDYSVNTTHGTWSEELGHGRVNAMAALELNSFTSIEELANAGQFDLWQTLEGAATLYAEMDQREKVTISLYGSDGRVIRDLGSFNLTEGQNKLPIDLPHLNAGLYILRIQSKAGTISFNLIR